jgi:hypothetical protein
MIVLFAYCRIDVALHYYRHVVSTIICFILKDFVYRDPNCICKQPLDLSRTDDTKSN